MPETAERPHVDPSSVLRHIVASATFIREHLKGQLSAVLAQNHVGSSPDYSRHWFRDTAEVREVLGMEEK